MDVELESRDEQPSALYVLDLPGFAYHWTHFLWLLILGGLLGLSWRHHSAHSGFDQTAMVPQYAPYFPYSFSVRLPNIYDWMTTLRVSLSFDDLRPATVITGNISAFSDTKTFGRAAFSVVAAAARQPIFQSDRLQTGRLDVRLDFDPGLSPENRVHVHVAHASPSQSLLLRWVRLGFATAVAVQLVLFVVRPSGHCGIDRIQALTVVLSVSAVVALLAPPPLAKRVFRGYKVWYCAALFANFADGFWRAMALPSAIVCGVAATSVVPLTFVIVAVLSILWNAIRAAATRRNTKKLLLYILFVAPACGASWYLDIMGEDSASMFDLVRRGAVECAFVIAMNVAHVGILPDVQAYGAPEDGDDIGAESEGTGEPIGFPVEDKEQEEEGT
jgi:hypothetical protein